MNKNSFNNRAQRKEIAIMTVINNYQTIRRKSNKIFNIKINIMDK